MSYGADPYMVSVEMSRERPGIRCKVCFAAFYLLPDLEEELCDAWVSEAIAFIEHHHFECSDWPGH